MLDRSAIAVALLCALTAAACGDDRPDPPPVLMDTGVPVDSGTPVDSAVTDGSTDGATDSSVTIPDGGPPVRTCLFSEAAEFPLATAQVWMTDSPALAARNDQAIVGWVSLVDSMPRLSILSVPADPADSLSARTVTTAASRQRNPVIVALNEGFLVVWRDDDDGDFEIMARVLDAAGQPMEPLLKLTNNSVDEGPPSVGVNSAGRVLLGWVEDPEGTPAGRMLIMEPDGSPSGGTRTSAEIADARGQVAIGAVGDVFGLVWVDSGLTARLRRFDDTAAPIGEAVALGGEANATGIISIATATDGSGAALYDSRAGGIRAELRFRTFDDGGQPFGTEAIVTPPPMVAQSSSLAALGGGYATSYRGAATDGAAESLQVELLNGDGSPGDDGVSLADTVPPATFTIIRSSPDGLRVYVGWTDDGRMKVARVECE